MDPLLTLALIALAGWTVALAALALAGRSRRQAAVREVYRSAPPASSHPTTEARRIHEEQS